METQAMHVLLDEFTKQNLSKRTELFNENPKLIGVLKLFLHVSSQGKNYLRLRIDHQLNKEEFLNGPLPICEIEFKNTTDFHQGDKGEILIKTADNADGDALKVLEPILNKTFNTWVKERSQGYKFTLSLIGSATTNMKFDFLDETLLIVDSKDTL